MQWPLSAYRRGRFYEGKIESLEQLHYIVEYQKLKLVARLIISLYSPAWNTWSKHKWLKNVSVLWRPILPEHIMRLIIERPINDDKVEKSAKDNTMRIGTQNRLLQAHHGGKREHCVMANARQNVRKQRSNELSKICVVPNPECRKSCTVHKIQDMTMEKQTPRQSSTKNPICWEWGILRSPLGIVSRWNLFNNHNFLGIYGDLMKHWTSWHFLCGRSVWMSPRPLRSVYRCIVACIGCF